jgi:outer membrane protein assembly factor BamB
MLVRPAVTLLALLGTVVAPAAAGDDANWPSFRGADARGVSDGAATAVRWNVEDGTNVRWRTPVPGLAHSSPVIWGDRLFVTTAVRPAGEETLKVGLYGAGEAVEDEAEIRWMVYCLDKGDGTIRWARTAREGVPEAKRHPKSSHASSTPATDGRRLVAFFGSEGLYCYDLDGDLLWERDFGVLKSGPYNAPTLEWGFASSPIIHDDLVIVQCDVMGDPFLAALSVDDGTDVWRVSREEVCTWSTPTVHVGADRAQVIVNGWKHIGGYDLRTGAELWTLAGGGDVPVPTPVVAHDLIFITNAHGRQAPIYAIRTDVTGRITDDAADGHMAWSQRRRGNYMQTPLVYGDELYCCHDTGVLTCYDARTGEQRYRERLGAGKTGFSASAVAADGKVYVSSEDGEVHVLRAGPAFEVIAVNDLGETCMATPAVSEGVLFFRSRGHVVAVEGPPGE